MSAPGYENYQALADSMNELLYAQVAAATPVEILSDRNDKLVQLVETADGERFVTRSFTPEAVRAIDSHYGLDFRFAWDEMHDAFSEVGIEVVPSRLIATDGEYPYIAVSEYLGDAQPLALAPTEAKQAAAGGLASLLAGHRRYIPAPEMVKDDMFLAVEREGRVRPVLVDTDPLMVKATRIRGHDEEVAFYIRELAEDIWDHWCPGEDRASVAAAVVEALGDFALDNFDLMESSTGRAFTDLHIMTNGLDHRHMWSED